MRAALHVEGARRRGPRLEPAALFEAFGLPMSFSPSHRPNEDEVNAKEVR